MLRDRTIPLIPLLIGLVWTAATGLLIWASFDHAGRAPYFWDVALLAAAVTLSVCYVVSRQSDLIRRAYDLGQRAAGRQPAPVRIRR